MKDEAGQIQTQMEALSGKAPYLTQALPQTVSALTLSQMIQLSPSLVEGGFTSQVGLNEEDSSEIVQVVDLQQYTPLGGVFYFDLFHLPPQARHVNGWEIRQVNGKD